MHVEPIQQQSAWNDTQQPSFLQTWLYGECLTSIGRVVKRFRIRDEYVQVLEYRGRFGVRSLYLPHASLSGEALHALVRYARAHAYAFIRCELLHDPRMNNGTSWMNSAVNTGSIRLVESVLPQHVWKTSLEHTPDDLWASFHKKTRYAIRVAEKNSVVITEQKDADTFYALLRETGDRQSFLPQSEAFVRGFIASAQTRQFMAYQQDQVVAGAVFWVEPDRWTYVLGASATAYRSTMGASLLHWYAMQEAVRCGAKEYDWWGTAPFVEKDHPHAESSGDVYWDGSHPQASLARFKVRFGGVGVSYQPAFDIVLRPGVAFVSRIADRIGQMRR